MRKPTQRDINRRIRVAEKDYLRSMVGLLNA